MLSNKRAKPLLLAAILAASGLVGLGYSMAEQASPALPPSELFAPAVPAQVAPAGNPEQQVIVRYKFGVDTARLRTKFDKYQAVERAEIKSQRVMVLRLPAALRDQAIRGLQADSDVQSVEIDVARKAEATSPNDPYYGQQWIWPKVQMDSVWGRAPGPATRTIVAVLDSGINFDHPEFAGKTVAGYDFINNDDDPADDSGHGSWVSGIYAARTGNNSGIAAGCWNCKIMPVKILDNAGNGTLSSLLQGVQYAIDNNANVINLSLGGPTPSAAEQDAISLATGKGVFVVASAGNSGKDTAHYPSDYDNVVSVAATERDDTLHGSSSFGTKVDIAAPGRTVTTDNAEGNYVSADGTSVAVPVVGSLFAELKGRYPQASPAVLTDAILSSADPCCGRKIAKGRLNALKALGKLEAVYPTALPQPSPSTKKY